MNSLNFSLRTSKVNQLVKLSIAFAAFSIAQAAMAKVKPLTVHGIENPKIMIKSGGPLAAVQPRANLVFEYASCSQRDFSIRVSALKSGVTNLTVLADPNQKDCKGPRIKRSYSLTVSTDAKAGAKYVLTNPLPLEFATVGTKPPAEPTPVTKPDQSIVMSPELAACIRELDRTLAQENEDGTSEGVAPISKNEALALLEDAPWDEVGETELANAKNQIADSMSLVFSLNWEAPSNSGTSVVIVPNRDNCRVYSSYVVWSEE